MSKDPKIFYDRKAIEFLISSKIEIYPTESDFDIYLISRLNDLSNLNYVSNETSKYMQVKCSQCKKFSFWFKNKDDIDMEAFKDAEFNDEGEKEINLVFFRSIN